MWGWLTERISFWYDAFGLWWLLVAFIWTIFSNAATVRDNFLSTEYQQKWGTLRIMPKLSIEVWLLGILLLTLMAAMEGAFRAWRVERNTRITAENNLKLISDERRREQEKRLPDLVGHIVHIDFGEPGGFAGTGLMLTMTISNHGADSTIDGYHLDVTLPDGKIAVKGLAPVYVPVPLSMKDENRKKIVKSADSLFIKTAQPLKEGHKESGVLVYALAGLSQQQLSQAGTKLQVTFYDFDERPFSAIFVIPEVKSSRDVFVPGIDVDLVPLKKKRKK
jgi:hypothetical protein